MTIPEPGLTGDYTGSCVVCLRGTDTGLAFDGPAEWAEAGLRVLGVPEDQASVMLSNRFGCEPGQVPDGDVTVPVTVCQRCVDACPAPFKAGLIATGLPSYSPMVRYDD